MLYLIYRSSFALYTNIVHCVFVLFLYCTACVDTFDSGSPILLTRYYPIYNYNSGVICEQHQRAKMT